MNLIPAVRRLLAALASSMALAIVTLPVHAQPASRIISLAPSLTEMVFAAGGGEALVAVSAFSDFPPAARSLPQVADASGISWESLLAQKPDLVLAWQGGTRPADIARLKSLGLNVLSIEIKRLEDVPAGLRAIGAQLRDPEIAAHAAVEFEWKLQAVRRANAGKKPVKVFFEISARPLMTINRDHVISEMLVLCGGVNVFADAPGLVSEPTREALLQRGADAILYASPAAALSRDFAIYKGLTAFREMRIYAVTADLALRPGPRLLPAAEEICTALDRARTALKGEIQ